MKCDYSCDGVPARLYKTSDEEEVEGEIQIKNIEEIIIEGLRSMGTYTDIVTKHKTHPKIREALKQNLLKNNLIKEDVDLKNYKELIKTELEKMSEEEDEEEEEKEDNEEQEEEKEDNEEKEEEKYDDMPELEPDIDISENKEDVEDEEVYVEQSKLSWYFKPYQGYNKYDLNKLKFTEESLYSITPWKEADEITKKIIEFFGTKKILVTDATANVGGNTISFYNNGIDIVNSVEIDKNTCNMLKNNLKVYDYPTDRVYCENYLNIYLELLQDIVFFDPPWGGPEYYKEKDLNLFLGNRNVVDIIYELLSTENAELAVLKAPINFNFDALIESRFNDYDLDTLPIYRGKNRLSLFCIFCKQKTR